MLILNSLIFKYYNATQAKPWSSSTVQSAWTCTPRSRHGTITRTEHTSAPVFLTCYSWSIRNTDLSDPQINLSQGTIKKFYLTSIGIQVKDIMAACSTTGCFRMSSNFRLDSVSNLTDSWHNLPIISLNFATLIVIYLYYLEFLELITILFNTERKDFVQKLVTFCLKLIALIV